mmetsp:Transcript_61469/g.116107  ORF Transcript_61469/g.116107 Transcript_61469/m.116107 type:complete len:516 (-) Transcript_61469:183-1730(-)
MALNLGLNESECVTDRFVRLFSGDVDQVDGFGSPWATPYALSIYGQEQYPNGAGPNGNGYGDGRAISIAEVLMPESGERWELQLKGSGPTPFCRGSDGRAVLRSSVREFLASEAMYHLGVPTARALSLVASGTEHVSRPWYSEKRRAADARSEDAEEAEEDQKHGGDVMQEERCAMTTRAAPSFLRVGHFELYGRRAARGDVVGKRELEQLARHALFREYPQHANASRPFQEQLLGMVSEAASRFAKLAAHWLRVGYVQSNFNADNCLVSGLTVDYGPFGFIEKYDPEWGMWIGSGRHFSFMNQHKAAGQNFKQFALSLKPLLDAAGVRELHRVINGFDKLALAAVHDMYARKLGFQYSGDSVNNLWSELEQLMREHPTDYTILWRQLAEVVSGHAAGEINLTTYLKDAFYKPLTEEKKQQWTTWVSSWLEELGSKAENLTLAAEAMRKASPKYVPRESLLVEAYTGAQRGDHSALRALQELFRHPYEEQPFFGERYYHRRAPGAETQGGVGYMS